MTSLPRIASVCTLTLLLASPGLHAGPSVAILGVSGGVSASAEAGEEPAGTTLLSVSGSFSTRQALAGGGYLSLLSSAGCRFDDAIDPADHESLQLKLALPAGFHRLEAEAGWNSTLLGSPASLSPNWRLGFIRHGKTSGSELELSTAGSWVCQPLDQEDVFRQEIRAGLTRRPSLRLNWETSAGAGYEHYSETFLMNPAGAETKDTRRDLLVDLQTTAGGLWGYFADWTLTLGVSYRSSNATRHLASLFDGDSESRLGVFAGGELIWSPRHNISVHISSFAAPSFYLFREARREDNSYSAEKLTTLTCGGSLRTDWTADHRLYLVLAGDAERTFSNDPAEAEWYFSVSGGLEISY